MRNAGWHQSAFAMALIISAIACGFAPSAHAATWYGGAFGPSTYTDYGQSAYHTPPSTKVGWFTNQPVVIVPSAVVAQPETVYEPVPPPMVVSITTVEADEAY